MSQREHDARGGAAVSRLASLVLILGALLVALGGIASSAEALVYTDPVSHHRFGIVPSPNAPAAQQPAVCTVFGSDTCSALVYHGGPVQHGEKDYLFFWAPPSYNSAQLTAYENGMNRWLDDLASANYTGATPISVTQQYYDNSGSGGSKQFIPFAIQNGGVLVDTNPYPTSGGCTVGGYSACLTDGQLSGELSNYISANGLPTGVDVEYFILTPPGVDSCVDSGGSECAYSAYCGYHTYLIAGGVPTTYANMPWTYQTGCDVGSGLGAGYANTNYIDSTVGVFSHELSETMTDPEINGWYGVNGGADEIGDKCAYNYGGPSGTSDLTGLSKDGNGGDYNVKLGSDYYLMQLEYDNRTTDCRLQDSDVQPSASLSGPAHAFGGEPATFSLTGLSDPAGIAYVNWNFGDGSTATTTSASVHHTYENVAGLQHVTAILTDNDGNELSLSTNVTVVLTPPVSQWAPAILGNTNPGSMLTEVHGGWSGAPTAYSYQWQRCSASGGGCASISGASGQAYMLTTSDVGHALRVLETAYNAGGTGSAASSPATSNVQPTSASVLQLLASLTTVHGANRKVARLVAARGGKFSFQSPSPGVLSIVWREAHGSRLVIARGSAVVQAGTGSLRLKLTPKGRSVLKHLKRHKSLALLISATFTPTAGPTTTTTKKLTLTR